MMCTWVPRVTTNDTRACQVAAGIPGERASKLAGTFQTARCTKCSSGFIWPILHTRSVATGAPGEGGRWEEEGPRAGGGSLRTNGFRMRSFKHVPATH
jgi:hypothetical protein